MDNLKSANEICINTLVTSGLIDAQSEIQLKPNKPWYITVFLVVSAWLSAIFAVTSTALTFVMWIDRSEIAAAVVGSLLFAGAVKIIKSSTDAFLSHLGLALSLAGQSMFLFGLSEWVGLDFLWLCVVFSIFNLIALLVIPQYEHRFISSVLAGIGGGLIATELAFANVYSGVMLLIAGLIWLYRLELASHIKHVKAIAYGLTLCLCQIKTSAIFIGHGVYASDLGFAMAPWLDEVVNIIGMFIIGGLLLQKYWRHLPKPTSMLLIGCFAGIALCSLYAHGLALSFALVMIALSQSNRLLFFMAIVIGVINLSSYYYLVDFTLVEKSAILALIALMCGICSYMALALVKREQKDA